MFQAMRQGHQAKVENARKAAEAAKEAAPPIGQALFSRRGPSRSRPVIVPPIDKPTV
jgi:hypothetical protein